MSKTYIAGIVSIIAFVLPLFGLDIANEGTVNNLVTNIAGAIGAIYVFIGRYKAGGITAFGLRKTEDKI